jgi:hypothetical protein
MVAGLGHALAALQDRQKALRVAKDLERLRASKGLFAYELGVILAALGDRDHAFERFVGAVRERSGGLRIYGSIPVSMTSTLIRVLTSSSPKPVSDLPLNRMVLLTERQGQEGPKDRESAVNRNRRVLFL